MNKTLSIADHDKLVQQILPCLGTCVEKIGFDKPFMDFSRDDALMLIDTVVTNYVQLARLDMPNFADDMPF